jgi:threonine synthase
MIDEAPPSADRSRNPFLRYRHRLDSYDAVRRGDLTDGQFVGLVTALDQAVADADGHGHGFVETPVVDGDELAAQAGLDVDLVIKAEPHNVGGSHKARHLMGVAIQMKVAEALGESLPERLAIASCGNAAIGASVVARALELPLDVFVPTWAGDSVLDPLRTLGAEIHQCERRPGEAGDPCYLRFSDAVDSGSTPFSVQGSDTPSTFDGGRTLGWELADQVDALDAIYVQVGGGALATAVGMAMPGVALFPVQAEGCAPLRRAWDLLAPGFDFDAARANPTAYMWPWDDPYSYATGILDDVTYDWLPLVQATHASGGEPIVAPESLIVRAHQLAKTATAIPVCSTGAAGLAGLLQQPPRRRDDGSRQRVALLFTGIDRTT